jgi:hypothetical protein
MSRRSETNFVLQQGFRDARAEERESKYEPLMFQPRLVGVIVVLATIFQSWPTFLILSVVLWWNVVIPGKNLFDVIYNRFIASPQGPKLTPAPAPRRFAQSMAATFMLGIGLCLLLGYEVAAWTLEGLLFLALASLIFGKFCLGSYLYYVIRGDRKYANCTVPWSRREPSEG